MNGIKIKKLGSFIAIFIASLLPLLCITGIYIDNKLKFEEATLEQLLFNKASKISSVVTKLLYKTSILASHVIQSNGEIGNFEQIATIIVDDPSIKNIIIAPNGVVSNAYPLESNEEVIGLNYFSEGAGNREAMMAKESGQLVLGGPFQLVQGGAALVGRLPVYIGNKKEPANFWGLVSVTLNYPEVLAGAELEHLEYQNLSFEIWRISPDTNQPQTIASNATALLPDDCFLQKTIKILNATWYFKVGPLHKWYQYPETWLLSIINIIVSYLLAALILHNKDLKKMKNSLESLTYTDPLTGILNRRGIFKELSSLINDRRNFVLCFIDLNKFKSINDTYGHSIGDQTLITFASIVQRHLSDGQMLARIGGDEFILIFKGTVASDVIAELFAKLAEEFRRSVVITPTQKIDIGFSYGLAEYPQDGATIDDLIAHADNVMYENKYRNN